jgi:serine/threonine-protein kinase
VKSKLGKEKSEARMPEAGESFADHELGDLLGEGGMGKVYKASRPDGQVVALKVLRTELGDDEAFRKRFEREALMATRVQHAHVVKTLDAGEHEGVLYLTQEFISGGSLDETLEREEVLELAQAVRICLEVAAGLDAMHAADLVHRDIKPHNIMLDGEGTAYIADFGLAKDREASTVLTRLGQAMGSLDYMAPEQIRGVEVDARADVYALGCVMYECLTGKAPFADRKGMQVMWAHLRDEAPNPCDVRSELPDSVGWTITMAMAKEPDDRPPTATAYARMLQMASGPSSGPGDPE